MYISQIQSNTYAITDTLYAPTGEEQIEYNLTLKNLNDHSNDVAVSLINSSKGYKYKLKTTSIFYSETYATVLFSIDSQASEKANIDFIEVLVRGEDFVKSAKLKVNVKTIETATKNFVYKFGNLNIIDSNLLSLRPKYLAARWSTLGKNMLSNGSKLLDQFHNTYSSSYFKTNEYLRQAYISDYSPFKYERVFLTKRPMTVLRYADYWEELKETEDINSSIKKLNINYNYGTKDLPKVILEPFESNSDEIDRINMELPCSLYFKKDRGEDDQYATCIIKGKDQFDNIITETLLVRLDVYTKPVNTFYNILEISCSDIPIEISTYVDLRYDHYVINNSFIIPPIVDKDYRTFIPLVKKESNSDISCNTLSLYNPSNSNNSSELTFSFKEQNVTSIYVTEDLDILYTVDDPETTYLKYSKLHIDFSKNIYNNTSLNNNDFINVSEALPCLNDWIDVNINIKAWSEYSKDNAAIIQIRNEDNIYYYDAETNSLVNDRVFVYSQTTSDSPLSFSVQIENDSPYIVTVFSSDLKQKAACSAIANTIIPYKTEEINFKNKLMLIDSQIILSDLSNTTISLNKDPTSLYITLEWDNFSTLDYSLVFYDRFLSHSETNLPEDSYTYITNGRSCGGPIVIKIDPKMLPDNLFSIGAAINRNCGVPSYTSTIITVEYNGSNLTLDLPIQEDVEDVALQYEINIQDLTSKVLYDN